tara:strand:+ start:2239 stop:3123 length:885 start_codon:yes stop_codon:yes gene_type:complete
MPLLGIAAIAGVGVSLWGTHQASNAAKDQAEAQNEAALAQYGYNLEKYELDKDKIDADREHALDLYQIRLRNEQKSAQWRDDINNQKYLYDLQIRNRQQSSLDTQFAKSNKLYGYQTTLNEQIADAALENELIKLREIHAEAAFEVQDQRIEALEAEGTARSLGQSGRSAKKVKQSMAAKFLRNEAMINESLESAGRNARNVIKDISRDKEAANLAAWAKKMLDPGVLPDVIKPIDTPIAEFQEPREVEEFDYGPEPVLGAMASPSAAASQVWGQGLASMGSMATNFAIGKLTE